MFAESDQPRVFNPNLRARLKLHRNSSNDTFQISEPMKREAKRQKLC